MWGALLKIPRAVWCFSLPLDCHRVSCYAADKSLHCSVSPFFFFYFVLCTPCTPPNRTASAHQPVEKKREHGFSRRSSQLPSILSEEAAPILRYIGAMCRLDDFTAQPRTRAVYMTSYLENRANRARLEGAKGVCSSCYKH